MALEVVTGAPFSGKGRYVRSEIERREADGELGLLGLSFTSLYLALFPGDQSQLRDDLLGETGAGRLTAFVYEVVVTAALARELSGYVMTQSPRQAVELADRLKGPLVEVVADPGDIADRADAHMRLLRRTVARATVGGMLPRCRRQAVTYFREERRLVGRARVVRGGRAAEVKRPFDRAAWERGLTPRARAAIAELQSLGTADPTPAEVMSFVLKNRVDP